MLAPSIRSCSRRRALALGVGCLPLLAAHKVMASEAGIVSALRGRSEAVRDGETRLLHVGATVNARDSLRTHEGARLRLTLADGSTLALGEGSQVVLTEIMASGGRGGMVFDLLAGIVRAVLGASAPDVFAVRGRAAVAAARSTDFIVETTASSTAVFVNEGMVAVDEVYGGATAVLAAGQGIDVLRGRPFGPAREWGRARVEDVLERTATGD